jgi:RNA methyltransferase, TrmH family
MKKNKSEVKIYGLNAVKAVFKKRAQDVIKLYVTAPQSSKLKDEMKQCAQLKKAYHIVEDADLEKLTKSTHHEGVCIVAIEKQVLTLSDILQDKKKKTVHLIGLDDVQNPHNLGAIIRSCAHFKIDAILICDKNFKFSGSLARTAEGGLEYVNIINIESWRIACDMLLKNDYAVFTTSSHAKQSLYEIKFPNKCLIMLGAEGPGLNAELLKKFNPLKIPGTDHVESLNVSVAGAVIMSEVYRQNYCDKT